MSVKGGFVPLIILIFLNQNVCYSTSLKGLDFNLELNKGSLSNWKNDDDVKVHFNLKMQKISSSVQDTSSQVFKLLKGADVEKNNGNYSKAYDYLWEALFLAESSQNLYSLAECHYELGMLFGIFNKKNEALTHMKRALGYRKELLKQSMITEDGLIKNYFGIAVRFARSENFRKAKVYLDTCITIARKNEIKPYYILAEKANIAIHENELEEAEQILNQTASYFFENSIPFEVIIYSFYGDLSVKQDRVDEAISYYNKCLKSMEDYNTHEDIKPEVLGKLAELYNQKGITTKAYDTLAEAKKINDSLFSAKNNSELLEVKNKYREMMQIKNKEMANQIKLLENRKEQNFHLKVFLGFVLLVTISGMLFLRNWYQRKRYKDSQYRLELKAKLEREKHEELVNIKNKEVTSYTLQLIDRERVIDELLVKLKKHLQEDEFKRTLNTTKGFNKNLWKEFNERFTMVNSDFYNKIKHRYPSLSPTELKHCALIKLSFNGKEMAQLLNISVPSVHVSRHRLRKKFGLKRGDNLAKFVGEI